MRSVSCRSSSSVRSPTSCAYLLGPVQLHARRQELCRLDGLHAAAAAEGAKAGAVGARADA
eukprot:5470190-Prymnesium_polylepis.1